MVWTSSRVYAIPYTVNLATENRTRTMCITTSLCSIEYRPPDAADLITSVISERATESTNRALDVAYETATVCLLLLLSVFPCLMLPVFAVVIISCTPFGLDPVFFLWLGCSGAFFAYAAYVLACIAFA